MKKIKHILVCGLAVVASAVAVQAQTLTQDWKMTTGLPSAAEGRAGVGFEGKVYTNFKANKSGTFRKYPTNCLPESYIFCNFTKNPRLTHHGLVRGYF